VRFLSKHVGETGQSYGFYSQVKVCPNMADKKKKVSFSAAPNLGRHESGCRICAHPQRHEIEREFISWKSPAKIAVEYKLRDRSSVYRHAHAADLFPKRARNLRAALERLIERIDDVPASAGAIVQAIATHARINSQGQLVEPSEHVHLNDLFDRMTPEELEVYAKDGTLPHWFTGVVGATSPQGPGGNGNA